MDRQVLMDDETGDVFVDDYVVHYDYTEDLDYYYHMYVDGNRIPISVRSEDDLIEEVLFILDDYT